MKLPAQLNFQFSFEIKNFKLKIFLVSLLSVFCFLFSAAPSFAQAANPYMATNTDPNVPKNLHTWTQNVMLEVISAMSCELSGIDPTNPNQACLGVDQKTGRIGFVPNGGGAIGVMGNLIAMTFIPPIHTGDYFNHLAQNFGIAKHAYAATPPCTSMPGTGIGFCGLQPLMGLWSTFRNIVYLLFVFIFVAIGLAIMLRIKIDPRTVMSIENQIPKIIIGILLVTFSFAIAGFLIDMMNVSIYLVANTISPHTNNLADIQKNPPFNAVNEMIPGGVNGIAASSADGAKQVISNSLGIHDKGANYIPVFDLLPGNLNLLGTAIGAMANETSNAVDTISNLRIPKNILKVPLPGGGSVPFGFLKGFSNALLKGYKKAASFGEKRQKLGFFSDNNTPMDQLINIISTIAGVTTLLHPNSIPNIAVRVFGFGSNIPTSTIFAFIYGAGVFEASELLLRHWLPFFIPYLIIMIALIWALFRLWFQLIMAYVFILLDVVLAPFWIAAGLFPGVSIGFGTWLRDIIANLSAFPVTIAMFLLGKVFIDSFGSPHSTAGQFVPPLIGDPGNTHAIGSLIGLGIILMTPQVVTMMRDALKAPQLKYTAAIGQAVGAGGAFLGGTAGGAWGSVFRRNQMGQAVGPGAAWIDTRVKGRFMRGLLGWSHETIDQIEARARQGEQPTAATTAQPAAQTPPPPGTPPANP
ncbi:hypothetical protein M1615_04725 [Patescibacteria group bacterium]|nr:hypothetical protein [Patescibacteria group bacterium]MCL5010124.1 hypothetical protein [Patescibacteria group bacterium]